VKKILFISLAVVLALSVGLIGCTTPAEEEEEEEEEPQVISLTYGTHLGDTAFYEVATLNWIEKIEEETDGRVEIEPFFGGTVTSYTGCLDELEAGKVDIAQCAWTVHDGWDLLKKMGSFMYGVTSIEQQHFVDSQLRPNYPEIEADAEGFKILARSGGNSWHLFSREPVRTLDDFNGLTLRVVSAQYSVVEALGAEAVTPSLGECYSMFQTGIVDGIILDWAAIGSFNFYEVLDYCTILNIGTRVGPWKFMNLDSYNSLPADIQQIFDDNIEWFGSEIDRAAQEVDDAGKQTGLDAGMEIIELSPEDLAEFYALMENVAIGYAEELDAMGLPGTEIFEETRRLVEEWTS